MSQTVTLSVPIRRTPRVLQLEGIFDLAPSERSERQWALPEIPPPETWSVGLILGPSGSGKTTAARQWFPDELAREFRWPDDRAVVDAFPAAMPVKDIVATLSAVGFSSPPSWLRPFKAMSNGEQFRVGIARVLAECAGVAVIDEFTSVVDRTVARIASAAVAKHVRRAGRKLVAVTCHYDVVDWLQPDWILEMPAATLTRRSLRPRPPISLEIRRVHRRAWEAFKHHHYLSTTLHRMACCFVGLVEGRPAAFASAISSPGKISGWREHRTVCLPDYQGVGIGNALSAFVASLFAATGKPYYSVTSNPAMIRHRLRSRDWLMHRSPSRSTHRDTRAHFRKTRAHDRLCAGFRYVGPARPDAARRFGLAITAK
jgi:hypothetical protein